MTISLLDDPDALRVGTEIVLSTSATPWTIELAQAGNIGATTHVVGVAEYAALKAYWLDTSNQLKWPFPLKMITAESGILHNGWEYKDDTTRKRHALFAWHEKTTADYIDTAIKQSWCSIFAGYPSGVLDTEQCYYEIVTGTPSDFSYIGAVAEPIKYFGDVTHGNFDYSSNNISLRCRTTQRTFSSADVFGAYNTTALSTQLYRLSLNTSSDAKITVSDVGIDANSDGYADVSPYSGMILTGYASPQSFPMQGGSYGFSYVVDGNGAKLARVYEWEQWLVRQNRDIDSGSGIINGKCTAAFSYYIGDRLYTSSIEIGKGVYITNFDATDQNSCTFVDDTGAQRTFKYVAAVTVFPSAYAQSDNQAKCEVYNTTEWGTTEAVPLNDSNGDPMSTLVNGASSIVFTWDWSTYGDVDCVVVISGYATAQWEIGTFSFTQTTTTTVTVANAEELAI